MAQNFEIRMNGMETANVKSINDAVDVMMMMWKKHPSNTIYVNDMWVGCGRNDDGKWHIEMRDAEMNLIAGYVMGKIKRGFDKAIADVLEKGFNNNMEEKMIYTCADALNDVNTIVDFVVKNGVKMTIEDVHNVVDGLNIIKTKMTESDAIDEKVKDRFWYWCNEFKGLKNLLYSLESNLFNLKEVVE